MKLSIGFSTCPNDTFIFDALVHRRFDTEGLEYEPVLSDILHLNRFAREGSLDVVKVSYFTYSQIRDSYALLDAGSALGHGCGPLLISKRPISIEEVQEGNLRIGVPGLSTTANLLLSFFAPSAGSRIEMLFHEIMPALLEDRIDAGVIIHENRFTYQQHELLLIQDLGSYWESQTGAPIPLGGIVARKSLGPELIARIGEQVRQSVLFAFANPEASRPYVEQHAQELDPGVIQSHIQLYVNAHSVSLGADGHAAIEKLMQVAGQMRKQFSF